MIQSFGDTTLFAGAVNIVFDINDIINDLYFETYNRIEPSRGVVWHKSDVALYTRL